MQFFGQKFWGRLQLTGEFADDLVAPHEIVDGAHADPVVGPHPG